MLVEKKILKFVRLRRFFILTFMPLLLLPITTLIINPMPVSADAAIDKKIKTWQYYLAAPHCFTKNARIRGEYTSQNKLSPTADTEEKAVGVYSADDHNKQQYKASCQKIISEGYSLWGFKSLEELLMTAEFKYENGSWVIHDEPKEKVRAAIESKSSPKLSPDLSYFSDQELYELYYWSFVYACEIQDSDKVGGEKDKDAASESEKKDAEDHRNGYTSYHRVINGVLKEKIAKKYHTDDDRFISMDTKIRCSDKTAPVKKFSELAKKLGKKPVDKLAEEFEKALGEITPSDCLSIGSPSERKSCKLGHIEVCLTEAQKGVPSTITDKKEKDDKIKELFADCYSKKTGETKEKILAALSGVSPSSITAEPEPSGSTGGEEKAECAIEGIGWFVCPIVTFLTGIADLMYKFISKQFLEISPEMISDKSLGTAWGSFRDIANVAFVIAFLAIVYSQITQTGINNYGIKRLLPRLFIAAVLVNSSLLICQICVDLSNMIGYSVVGLFENISIGDAESTSTPEWIGEGITFGAVGVTALGAGIVLALAFLGPVLLASILALLATVLMLVARKAIVVILIVIAPLAFVAYLLPNTESLYKKWQKMFIAMLILFPTIGVVFGGSSLAAKVLVLAGGNGEGSTLLQITALGISAVPLFVVPSLARQTMQATGSIGGKLAGLSAAANKNALKKANKESAFARYRDARKRDKAAKRAAIFSGQYKKKGHLLANATSKGFGFANSRKHSPEFMKNASRQAAADKKKLEVDKVEAAQAEIEQANIDQNSLRALANGQDAAGIRSDKYTRAAAMNMALDTGDYTTAAESWNNTRNEDQETRAVFANTVARSDNRPAFITSSELSSMRSAKNTKKGEPAQTAATRNLDGTENPGEPVHDFATMAASQIRSGAYSPERIAQASTKELKYAQSVASQDEDAWKAMQSAAKKATDNPNVDQSIGKNRQILEDIVATSWKDAKKKFSPPPPPPPPAAATSSNP